MKRRALLYVGAVVAVIAIVAIYVGTTPRDGLPTVAIFNLLSHPILDDSIAGIKEQLAEEGYTSDKVRFIDVNANGETDKLDAFANEILAAKPDVIVPVSTPVSLAVFNAAPPDQKIIFSTVTNPDDVGMAKKPANMTGVADAVNYEANLKLIKELLPNAKTVGIVYNAGERNSQFGVDQVKVLAPQLGLELKVVSISKPDEVEDAAKGMVESVDVFYVGSDNTVVGALPALLNVADAKRVPVIASDSGSVEKGALAAVSVDYKELGRKVGAIVAQVLRTGKMPVDLSPVKFLGDALLLNEGSAKKIEFSFPEAVRQRAQKVIQ